MFANLNRQAEGFDAESIAAAKRMAAKPEQCRLFFRNEIDCQTGEVEWLVAEDCPAWDRVIADMQGFLKDLDPYEYWKSPQWEALYYCMVGGTSDIDWCYAPDFLQAILEYQVPLSDMRASGSSLKTIFDGMVTRNRGERTFISPDVVADVLGESVFNKKFIAEFCTTARTITNSEWCEKFTLANTNRGFWY